MVPRRGSGHELIKVRKGGVVDRCVSGKTPISPNRAETTVQTIIRLALSLQNALEADMRPDSILPRSLMPKAI